ncbi:hypothetical protein DPSP01_014699, partial [Paraphaeosphaeria sporulosa]
YWTIYFLHGSNGHDYFLVGHLVANGTNLPISSTVRVSLLDINDGYYFGEAFHEKTASFAIDTFSYYGDKFQTYSLSPDLYSTQVVKSSVEGAEFHIVSSPRGPNLYDAGSGAFFWGENWTYEVAYPEQWVTGNITYKGDVVDIVSEQSASWFDRQFGVGVGSAGWHLWILLLDNGMKLTIWRSDSVNNNPKQYFATVLFPDGHHEVYPIDANIHASEPYVSADTGLTYYGRHIVTIPGLGAHFDIRQPHLAGEMTDKMVRSEVNQFVE